MHGDDWTAGLGNGFNGIWIIAMTCESMLVVSLEGLASLREVKGAWDMPSLLCYWCR